MPEASILTVLADAGASVLIAAIFLIVIIRISSAHAAQMASIVKQVCDLTERDIKSRDEYTKTTQGLTDVIKYMTDAFLSHMIK